jgi:hypothetical protein
LPYRLRLLHARLPVRQIHRHRLLSRRQPVLRQAQSRRFLVRPRVSGMVP